MSIKQKLLLMGAVMAILVGVICAVGYHRAQSALAESTSNEIDAALNVEAASLNGWLLERKQLAQSAANLLTAMAGSPMEHDRSLMSLATGDKAILDLSHGAENGTFISWVDGDITAEMDPRTRDWYKDAKAADAPGFTSVYQDSLNKKLIISATAPYRTPDGTFAGAVCADVTLDTLSARVQELKYHGEGKGVIIDRTGIIITDADGNTLRKASDDPVLKDHLAEMQEKKQGHFVAPMDDEEQIIAYTTVPETGWIIAIAVPERVAFAQLADLRISYAGLTIVGILLVIGIIIALLRFAATITTATEELTGHVDALAHGRLNLPDLPVNSDDELGRLAANFNTMTKNIRDLIKQVASTAEQLAASSEELTAGAHQMAESATEIAGTVSSVANGTEKQLTTLSAARSSIHKVSDDIGAMSAKSDAVADESAATADAAKKGASLMNDAMDKMTAIEQSVQRSAEVVEKLGESSQQIGEIVETISAIAEQTNLLALNAAIEAARAGETGRGFAVVAEEVRKLAEQSRDAADQIKERISSVQNDTTHAVTAMHTGTEEVQVGAGAIHAVGEQFDSIMHKVDAINTEMTAINAAMQNVAQGAEEIVHAAGEADDISQTTATHMQTIASASESQSASSEEIAAASQALATLATDLQNTTQKFRF